MRLIEALQQIESRKPAPAAPRSDPLPAATPAAPWSATPDAPSAAAPASGVSADRPPTATVQATSDQPRILAMPQPVCAADSADAAATLSVADPADAGETSCATPATEKPEPDRDTAAIEATLDLAVRAAAQAAECDPPVAVDPAYRKLAESILAQVGDRQPAALAIAAVHDDDAIEPLVAQLAAAVAQVVGRTTPVVDAALQPLERLGQVLGKLKKRHPVLMVEAGCLPDEHARASVAACDGTYLVARLGQVRQRALRQAGHAVAACGGRLLGCIVLR